MSVSTFPVDEATTDIRDLERMPTSGPIEYEVDDNAAVSYCVCGGACVTATITHQIIMN